MPTSTVTPGEAKPVLVTGAAGYIGSHALLALLAAGYHPVVLDNLSTGVRRAVPDGVPFYEGDVGDGAIVAQILSRHQIEAVLHFAGSIVVPESVENPLKYYRNNTANSLALIEQCVAAGVRRFIFSSTAAVYGEPERTPVREDDPKRPMNPYGASKLMTERMLEDAAAAHPGFHPVSLRYFNVAGADPLGRTGQQGPQSTHLIRAAIETALGRRPVLDVFGTDYDTRDGSCERDFIHVSDLADAHVAALAYLEDGGEPTEMNCGYGRGYTVLEVIQAIEAVTGEPLAVRRSPRRIGDPARIVSDVSRLGERLNWSPRHADLAQIIRSALNWQASLEP